MTILDTLKSLLGLESQDGRPETDEDVGVTVEREAGTEPDAATERAVKGVSGSAAETAVSEVPEESEVDEDEEATAETGAAGDADGEDGDEPEAGETKAHDESETAPGTDESPEVLEGIGPAYAERLADAGVETVADLAAADVSSLAEEAEVSESRLERWIERAKNR